MTTDYIKSRLPLAAVAVAVLLLAGVGSAYAAEAPVKEVISSHWGFGVNASTKGDVCTVESKDTCRPATESVTPGGFLDPSSLAVDNDPTSPDYGDVYIADYGNARVQELTASGSFVRMFGKEVNETTKGTVCTEEEIQNAGVKCKRGLESGVEPSSIAVDPTSGNVYLLEVNNARVVEYTASGQFVLAIGGNVDKTKVEQGGSEAERNLCTAESGDVCQDGTVNAAGSSARGAFNFNSGHGTGNALAVGPEQALYVGGAEQRVQEFDAEGKYRAEIALAAISAEPDGALAVNQATGKVYIAFGGADPAAGIYEFDAKGEQVADYPLGSRDPIAQQFAIEGMALDASGRLVVAAEEGNDNGGQALPNKPVGFLVNAGTGSLISEFTPPFAGPGAAFGVKGELYVPADDTEVVSYNLLPIGELATGATSCVAGVEHDTDATVECMLRGEVNPWGIPETEVWFQWGQTQVLGEETPRQAVGDGTVPVAVAPARIGGLKPNETYDYQMVGDDHDDQPVEGLLASRPVASFTTGAVAPKIVGEPSTPDAGVATAVLFAELNPEHTNTTYEFQYGTCEELQGCPGAVQTPAVQSSAYGTIGTTAEVSGLQPASIYHYRLLANNSGGEVVGGVGSFTTASEPAVQAQTGAVSGVSTTGAIVSGTVDPSGQAAAYSFELGIYNGADTEFGIVFSGSAGAGATPVGESLELSGLQAGTTYAYRIAAHSGDGSTAGEAAVGATLKFTTAGVPAVLPSPMSLAMLTVPPIAFPVEAKTTTGRALTETQKLAVALKACRKKASGKRAACERQARRRYAAKSRKKATVGKQAAVAPRKARRHSESPSRGREREEAS